MAPTTSAPAAAPLQLDVLYARDAEPNKTTPLIYRERTYVVSAETPVDVAERLLMEKFSELRAQLASRGKGKLVNMAVFDHRWEGRPERAPLVTLQWKDWRGEPELQRPSAGATAKALSMPPTSVPPPSASGFPADPAGGAQRVSGAPSAPSPAARPAEVATRKTPSARPVGTDDRLSQAFEGLQDLHFLTTPFEAAEFVLQLLSDLVPCEAGSVCLYDINSNELRFVAARGPGSEARKGAAIPLGVGLIGAVSASAVQPVLVEDVLADPRFDPGVDGGAELEARTMALIAVIHHGRFEAVIQLVNRTGDLAFARSDANLISYVAEKLGEFLHQTRLSERPPASRASQSRPV